MLSRKHYFNLRGQAKEKRRQFAPVLYSFLIFVRYWNKKNLLCAVSEYDWSFSNKLLEIANGYEEMKNAHRGKGRRRKG